METIIAIAVLVLISVVLSVWAIVRSYQDDSSDDDTKTLSDLTINGDATITGDIINHQVQLNYEKPSSTFANTSSKTYLDFSYLNTSGLVKAGHDPTFLTVPANVTPTQYQSAGDTLLLGITTKAVTSQRLKFGYTLGVTDTRTTGITQAEYFTIELCTDAQFDGGANLFIQRTTRNQVIRYPTEQYPIVTNYFKDDGGDGTAFTLPVGTPLYMRMYVQDSSFGDATFPASVIDLLRVNISFDETV